MLSLRTMILSVVALAALAALSGCGGAGRDEVFVSRNEPVPAEDLRAAAAGRNVLIVLLDAAAVSHMGCYGYDRGTTPAIDRLAAESVVFDNAYAQASGTMLSVFSFFTSRYPVFGDGFRIDERTILAVPPELTTLAEIMGRKLPRGLAYTSNTWLQKRFGHAQGFDEFWTLRGLTERRLPATAGDLDAIPLCVEWMKANAGEGFLAYLHLMKPHSPYDAPEPFRSRFAAGVDPRRGTHEFLQGLDESPPDAGTVADLVDLYDANMACVDAAVGGMIAALDSAGVWDDTILVLMADHGQSLCEYGHPHGHGGTVCEGALRVPLIIRVPGAEAVAGRRVAEPVELVDLAPTLADLTGAAEAGDVFAGISLLPLIAGGVVEPEFSGPNRFIHSRTNRLDPPLFAVLRGGYKLVLDRSGEAAGLYDLIADPGESRDLLADDPGHEIGGELLAHARAWLGSGGRLGSEARGFSLDVLDDRDIRRLRSLGYVR